MEDQFKNDKKWRESRANLPIEEKIKILVRLQRIAFTLAKQNGRACREPWSINV